MNGTNLPSVKYIDLRIRTLVPRLGRGKVEGIPWMNIMLSGSLEYILNDEPILLTEGHVSFFNVGDIVARQEQKTSVRYISMRFSPGDMILHLPPLLPLLGAKQHTLVEIFQNYIFEPNLPEEENCRASSLILNALLLELENNCRNHGENKWITDIQNYILQNYMNGIRPVDVAKAMALNPSYCNTLYRKHTGETISERIDHVRLDHVISKLIYSHMTIREIARDCGFRDVYYFSRWFRNQTNLSPSEYRQQLT